MKKNYAFHSKAFLGTRKCNKISDCNDLSNLKPCTFEPLASSSGESEETGVDQDQTFGVIQH